MKPHIVKITRHWADWDTTFQYRHYRFKWMAILAAWWYNDLNDWLSWQTAEVVTE